MYNDRDQCVVEMAREDTMARPTLKMVIDDCYNKSGVMIEDCIIAASNMFGDDFPKPPSNEPEPQSLLQTAACVANRLMDLDHMLTEIFSRTLG